MWAAVLSALVAVSSPCTAPVIVTGHGVPVSVVEDLQSAAPALEAHVHDALALGSCAPIRVELLPAIENADALQPPWQLPEWAAGAAVPEERRIVVAITARKEHQDRERILLHELAHVGVREAAAGKPVPRWLDEGVARTIAGEAGASDDMDALARARIGDRLFPLAALVDGFPARGDLAALAYAESGRAAAAIGPAVPAVLHELGRGLAIDDALLAASGQRSWQLDVAVEKSIPLASAWSLVGLDSELAYALAGLGFAWAGIRARRRIRERLRAYPDDAHPLFPDVHLLRWTVRRARA
ncbi:MAG TPA: hypothetical protein VGO62_02625 [Myxococcota bacterium]